jgi:hypothetical protein
LAYQPPASSTLLSEQTSASHQPTEQAVNLYNLLNKMSDHFFKKESNEL